MYKTTGTCLSVCASVSLCVCVFVTLCACVCHLLQTLELCLLQILYWTIWVTGKKNHPHAASSLHPCMPHMTPSLPTKPSDSPHAGVLGLLLFIPCFELGSGLYGDYPPMNEAGLQMLHDMYLDTGNTTGFWEALHVYQGSSSYRLVGHLLRKYLVCMCRCSFWHCMWRACACCYTYLHMRAAACEQEALHECKGGSANYMQARQAWATDVPMTA